MHTPSDTGQSGGQPAAAQRNQPAEEPIRPENNPLETIATSHERMQQRITLLLVALLALVIILTAALYATAGLTHVRDSDVRDFVMHFAPTLLTLLGAAIGFYFGDRRR